MQDSIKIKGARVNNLKNIDVEIPRGKLVVITGVSGSGKSSLAFDTLYAEGQRRYVESLSSYARQFLGRMNKPEVDSILGLPPAIAVEQKVKTRNARSTVGTSTEIYDYLRKLFARIGKTISPVSGELVKKHSTKDVLDYIGALSADRRYVLLSALKNDDLHTQIANLKMQGFSRVVADGSILRLDDEQVLKSKNVYLLIDRFTASQDNAFLNRIADSIETAFYEGDGVCFIAEIDASKSLSDFKEFSTNFSADGIDFELPTEQLFSFNSPLGACDECEGYGSVIGVDENLVIPNKTLSIYEGAVVCWRGEKMGEDKQNLIMNAHKFDFPIHKPYFELTDEQKELLWTGNEFFEGLNEFFAFLKANQYKIQYRVMLSRYRGRTICPLCNGTRLKKQASYVYIAGKNIQDLVQMSIRDLKAFFDNIALDEFEMAASKRLLYEINSRINCMIDVGLSYLTLNRASGTLSGGESQRINLVTSLGSSLIGSLYVLDEPSIGLHPLNTDMLIDVLRRLQQLGNTVVVVEHDETIMRKADWIIDIGPQAGRLGGEVVLQGNPQELINEYNRTKVAESQTLKYLAGDVDLQLSADRRKWSNYIEITGAVQNNLKNISVKFPLNVISVVTGVSGSGKSTLVRDIFYAGLQRHFGEAVEFVGSFNALQGSLHLIDGVEFVDQNPIGKSSRSNAATYLKAFDEIRRLFADQQAAKQIGYTAGSFSFNSGNGRCQECKGEGTITVSMQFMADVVLKCDACGGKRYTSELLEVKYRGKNIYDILEMTVNQAIEFFAEDGDNLYARAAVKRLMPLKEVGIGYIKMGQSASTLSGGESQRVKLAAFLSNDNSGRKVYIFDEPTTGLHFSDIAILMKALNKLVDKGHTVVIIEHNLDVIKQADCIIDMGPEGGDRGGTVVCSGTPEDIVSCADSVTGRYL